MRRDPYGAWLAYLRSARRLTQQELSARTGIPQRTLAHWERTGKLAGRMAILKLAKAFGVSVNELLQAEKTTKQE